MMKVLTEVTDASQEVLPGGIIERIPGALGSVAEEAFLTLCPGWDRTGEILLSVSFIDEEEMSRLNGRYMGEDYPTDVLSFPIHASDGVFSCPPDLPECLLGDIMICPAKVLENASEAGHSPLRELSLVLVHGLLHLFGWDHETEKKRLEMWEVQKRYRDRVERYLASGGEAGAKAQQERMDQ